MLVDYFESTGLKTITQFPYILFGKVDKDNASILDNIKSYPKLDNSLKLKLSYHCVYRVNDITV